MEGKYRPTQLGLNKWEELGNIFVIMLRMCETILLTGKCVVLGSGCFVSKRITAFLGFGVYAVVLVKKRKYCPEGVPADDIDQYFYKKDVTYVDMLEAITEDGPEGKAFNIFCFK